MRMYYAHEDCCCASMCVCIYTFMNEHTQIRTYISEATIFFGFTECSPWPETHFNRFKEGELINGLWVRPLSFSTLPLHILLLHYSFMHIIYERRYGHYIRNL